MSLITFLPHHIMSVFDVRVSVHY